METISESIRADVPPRFADRMWSEFVYRSLARGRPRSVDDARWWVDEGLVDKGRVEFAREGDRFVKVTVALEYTPRAGRGGEDAASQVRDHLRHDLESYRTFLVKRCEETGCLVAA
jgi:hypothetical protein